MYFSSNKYAYRDAYSALKSNNNQINNSLCLELKRKCALFVLCLCFLFVHLAECFQPLPAQVTAHD